MYLYNFFFDFSSYSLISTVTFQVARKCKSHRPAYRWTTHCMFHCTGLNPADRSDSLCSVSPSTGRGGVGCVRERERERCIPGRSSNRSKRQFGRPRESLGPKPEHVFLIYTCPRPYPLIFFFSSLGLTRNWPAAVMILHREK